MIFIKTLDGGFVQFDGKLKMKSLDADEEPELFYKYFRTVEIETGIELYVAILVCVAGKAIWGVASFGEQFDTIMDVDEGKELTEKEKTALLDTFYSANDGELQNLELFVSTIIIPNIIALCDEMSDDEKHILDVRKMYLDTCKQMGFFLAPQLIVQ